tara:strand:+ start:6701 stop:6883 length:183 start_codon:yes stop_codon:yes gene_type:complete
MQSQELENIISIIDAITRSQTQTMTRHGDHIDAIKGATLDLIKAHQALAARVDALEAKGE